MAVPDNPNPCAVSDVSGYSRGTLAALEAELCTANEDFERGDFIELTAEEIERCVETGESPWQGEFHG